MSRRWGSQRRIPVRALIADIVLTALIALLVVGWATQAPLHLIPPTPHRALDALAAVLLACMTGVLAVRRLWPWATLTTTAATTVGYVAGTYPYGPVFVPLAIAVYSLAARSSIRRSLSACGLVLVAIMAAHLVGTGGAGLMAQLPGWLAAGSGWLLAPWAVGVVVGFRREEAAREREQEARRYADEERLRIAREVHDVVGHRLAAINMQAGVALHVLERRPEQAGPALEAIKKSSKDALDELRGTLAVFRQPGGPEDADVPTRPTPGLAQLDGLVRGMKDSGVPVDVEITRDVGADGSGTWDGSVARGSMHAVAGDETGSPGPLPAAVDVAAYRIVQESLTNVLRHAGPASATVRIHRDPGELLVEIVDDGHARPDGDLRSRDPAGGHGIAGMRERAGALGGTVDTGPRSGGGFRVRARLPLADPPRAGKRTEQRPGES